MGADLTALTFPGTPSVDDEFPDPAIPGVPTWRWDGQKWVLLGGGRAGGAGGSSTGTEVPTEAEQGQLWWDGDALRIFLDGVWVEVISRHKLATNVRGFIDGLQYLWQGNIATFKVSAGCCNTDLDQGSMILANTRDVSPAVLFSAGGSRDTGSLVAGWWHAFLIDKEDFDAPAILVSRSAYGPTMPTDYVHKRRIFSYMTGASPFNPLEMIQRGDLFLWPTQKFEAEVALNSTAMRLMALANVPDGIVTEAILQMINLFQGAGYSENTYISSPLITGSFSALNTRTLYIGGNYTMGDRLHVLTNESRQIRHQTDFAGNNTMWVGTDGWVDPRGKNLSERPKASGQIFNFVLDNWPAYSWHDHNFRIVIPPSMLASAPGTQIQIQLSFMTGTNGNLVSAWVGHRGASSPNFNGSQVQLRFGGLTSIPITGKSYLSDPVTFTYNAATPLIVSWRATAPAGGIWPRMSWASGVECWEGAGADNTSATTGSGLSRTYDGPWGVEAGIMV